MTAEEHRKFLEQDFGDVKIEELYQTPIRFADYALAFL